MKVILSSDVDNLGQKGDVVEVAAGFARNYLLPKKLAMSATKGALKQAESMQKARQEKEKKELLVHQELAERISSTPLQVTMRAGDEGQLFGSVTNVDIADELSRALGHEIDRRKIDVSPVKSLGRHTFKVHLHAKVAAEGVIEVVSDRPMPTPGDPASESPVPAGSADSPPASDASEAGEVEESPSTESSQA